MKSIHDLVGNDLDDEVMGHIHVAEGESTCNLDDNRLDDEAMGCGEAAGKVKDIWG